MLLDTELLSRLDEKLRGDDSPGMLWHYTSVSAARAILEAHTLNLGCHSFMNDPGEGTVAVEVISDSWKNAVDAAEGHPRLDLSYVRDTKEIFEYFDFERPELPPTFLFSLTKLRDSLSQWSRYGDNGAGVALGFLIDPASLPGSSQRPWTSRTELVRVEYDDGASNPANGARPVVESLLRAYLPKFNSPTQIHNTLIELAHHLNPRLKRHAYAEESEWRIVTRTVIDSHDLYKVECNRFGFAPHVPLSFDRGVTLKEIMLGPKLSPENLWSAKWLCRKFGHEAEISRSQLAYR